MNTNFQKNDIVEATDGFGNYRHERGVIVDFKKNLLGWDLVEVLLDCSKELGNMKSSGFYPHELTLIEKPQPIVPEN